MKSQLQRGSSSPPVQRCFTSDSQRKKFHPFSSIRKMFVVCSTFLDSFYTIINTTLASFGTSQTDMAGDCFVYNIFSIFYQMASMLLNVIINYELKKYYLQIILDESYGFKTIKTESCLTTGNNKKISSCLKKNRDGSSRRNSRRRRFLLRKQSRDDIENNNYFVSFPGPTIKQKYESQKEDNSCRSNYTRDTDVSSRSALSSVHASTTTIIPENEEPPSVIPLPPMMSTVSSLLFSEWKTELLPKDGNSQQNSKSRISESNNVKKKNRRLSRNKKKSRRSMKMNQAKNSLFCCSSSSTLAEQIYAQNKILTVLNDDLSERKLGGGDIACNAMINTLTISSDNRVGVAVDYDDSSSGSDDGDDLRKHSIYYQATEEKVSDFNKMQESITKGISRGPCILATFGDDDILSLDVGNDYTPIGDWGLIKRFYREAIMKSFKDQTCKSLSDPHGNVTSVSTITTDSKIVEASVLEKGLNRHHLQEHCRLNPQIKRGSLNSEKGEAPVIIGSTDDLDAISVLQEAQSLVKWLELPKCTAPECVDIESMENCSKAGVEEIVALNNQLVKSYFPSINLLCNLLSWLSGSSLNSEKGEAPVIASSTDDLDAISVLQEAQSLVKWLELPKCTASECVDIESMKKYSKDDVEKIVASNNQLKEQKDEIDLLKEIRSNREAQNTDIIIKLSTLDNQIRRLQRKLIYGKFDLTQAKANEDVISLEVSDVITHHDRKVDYLRDKVQGMYASIQDLEEEIKTREEDIKTREEEIAKIK